MYKKSTTILQWIADNEEIRDDFLEMYIFLIFRLGGQKSVRPVSMIECDTFSKPTSQTTGRFLMS